MLEGLPRTASVLSVGEGICLGIDMSVLGNIDDDYITHVITLGFKQKKLERINTTRTQLIKEKQDLDIKYSNMLKLDRILRKKEAAFNIKEAEIEQREAELQKREAELQRRESELAKREAQAGIEQ